MAICVAVNAYTSGWFQGVPSNPDVVNGVATCPPSSFVLVSSGEFSQTQIQAQSVPQPLDYAAFGALWAAAFTFTVALHFFSRGVGAVLEMIRR